jgi:hypothetical protein
MIAVSRHHRSPPPAKIRLTDPQVSMIMAEARGLSKPKQDLLWARVMLQLNTMVCSVGPSVHVSDAEVQWALSRARTGLVRA